MDFDYNENWKLKFDNIEKRSNVVHTNNTFESKDLGNFVLIKSENYYHLYAHLSLVVVDTGMSVKK